MTDSYRFQIAFSFAGPHRDRVRAIAELVSTAIDPGIKDKSLGSVFFDEWFEHELGGDEAEVELQRIYGERSLMVVADVSDDYSDRPWCQAEASAIRAFRMGLDTARKATDRLRLSYIRFNDGEVPGVLKNAITWDGIKKTAEQLADLILRRRAALLTTPPALPNSTTPVPQNSTTPPPLPILFVHPATNDEFYSRRETELAWLDGCARNPDLRIATITGIGGLGKTSLVGHWISVHQGWQHRDFHGVFFYSFYSNRDPEAFFAAFLKFVCEVKDVCVPKNLGPLHHLAANACKRWPFLVVLDGLEVLQQGEDDPKYGWINDSELTEFVARVGSAGRSLLVLTSRFPFPQVTRSFPDNADALELPLLNAQDGAALLAKCGLAGEQSGPHSQSGPHLRSREANPLCGQDQETHIPAHGSGRTTLLPVLSPETQKDLERYSAQFGGHPLALRIFAGACKAAPFSEPEEVSAMVRADHGSEALPDPNAPGLDEEERQKRRQRRQFYKLLTWYQSKLSAPKRGLLQLVALFKEPVPTETLIALAQGMEAMKASFAGEDRASLLLDTLVTEHLLQREDEAPGSDTARWSAHPIVRDVFREAALHAGDQVAQQFAEIVAGKGEGTPKNVAQLQPILEAIEVLLAAGDFKAANELYSGRLNRGYVFLLVPASQEGLRCARGFVEPPERRAALEQALGRGRVGFYLNEVALWGNILGDMEGVERGYVEVNNINHFNKDWRNEANSLRNLAEAQILRGALREAVASVTEALFYAGVADATGVASSAPSLLGRPAEPPQHDTVQEWRSRSYRAHALALAGELPAASRDFTTANQIVREVESDNDALYSIWGIHSSRHRLRLGEQETARQLTLANQALCKIYDANSDLARCDLLLGELEVMEGNWAAAEERLSAALKIFRDAKQGYDLPDALLAMARLRRAQRLAGKLAPSSASAAAPAFAEDDSSLADASEALRMAQRSGFRLMECDILNFLALLHREAGDATTALREAQEALKIA